MYFYLVKLEGLGIGYRIFGVVVHVLLLMGIFGFDLLEVYVSLQSSQKHKGRVKKTELVILRLNRAVGSVQ